METESRLTAALDGLTETQRAVFTLRVSEGMSYREIAEVVGTTEGAARVHYHNAMRSVKEFLHE
jgi:RNA polymerase sigma-70 factor (ECF subfamily)